MTRLALFKRGSVESELERGAEVVPAPSNGAWSGGRG